MANTAEEIRKMVTECQLRDACWWDEEDDGNWDDSTLELVGSILGIGVSELEDMVQYVFTEMDNGGHSPYEFVEDFENLKKEVFDSSIYQEWRQELNG